MKYEPIEGIKMPELWKDWRHKTTAEEFEKFDLSFEFDADLTHVVTKPAPLQPARTDNLCHYTTYLVSPTQTYTFLRAEGRGYTFCDRFNCEQLICLT